MKKFYANSAIKRTAMIRSFVSSIGNVRVKKYKSNLFSLLSACSAVFLIFITGCSPKPSDASIKQEIIVYAQKCTWKLNVKGTDLFEIYSGQKIKVDSLKITAKSLEGNDGSVKFILFGEKIGSRDGRAWYGRSYQDAIPYLSDFFSFESEWKFKKYDTGWKICEEPIEQNADFIKR